MGFTFSTHRRDSGTSAPPGLAGRLIGSVFFLLFLAFGLAATGFMAHEAWRIAATYRWPSVPCRIVSSTVSEVDNASAPYRFVVSYEYAVSPPGQFEAAAVTYSSQRYRSGPADFSDYSGAQALVRAYPAGSSNVCYVDPADPAQVVLRRDTLWIFLFVAIPLFFAAVGGAGLVAVWREKKRPAVSKGAGGAEVALSDRALEGGGRAGKIGIALFFGAFLAMGVGISFPMLVLPVAHLVSARNWVATPCRVLSSRVASHSSEDGSTYSVDVFYEYEIAGTKHRSSRYNFLGGSSSGYAGKAAVVRQYPVGATRTCFVNSRDPDAAVLMRGLSAGYLLGLIPLVFAAVGVWGIRNVAFGPRLKVPRDRMLVPLSTPPPLRSTVRGGRIAGDATAGAWRTPAQATGPTVLKSTASPVLKFAGIVFICLFWNGIVSVFVVQAASAWRTASATGIFSALFLTLFLVPFVLVGLGLLIAVVYSILALFNPRPQLTVQSVALAPGAATQIDWQIAGAASRLTRLRITLEGREEATYRRGTTTTTDRNVFARVVAADTTEPYEMAAGRATLAVPADAMHTFEARNNKIVWRLRVRGEIPKWPDLDQEYPFVVLPPAGGEGGRAS